MELNDYLQKHKERFVRFWSIELSKDDVEDFRKDLLGEDGEEHCEYEAVETILMENPQFLKDCENLTRNWLSEKLQSEGKDIEKVDDDYFNDMVYDNVGEVEGELCGNVTDVIYGRMEIAE